MVGSDDGSSVGARDGIALGRSVGPGVGTSEGKFDGCDVGGTLGAGVMVGAGVGCMLGSRLGRAVGTDDGLIGEFRSPPSTRLLMVLICAELAASLCSPMSLEASSSVVTCPRSVTWVSSLMESGDEDVMVSSVVVLLSTASASATTSTMLDIIDTRLVRSASAAALAASSVVPAASDPDASPLLLPSSDEVSNTVFRRVAALERVLAASTTEEASTALTSMEASASLMTLAACDIGGGTTLIVSSSDAYAPTISMQRTSTTSAYDFEESPRGMEVVEAFMVAFEPRRTVRPPVDVDVYPKDHLSGSESASSLQPLVDMANEVLMLVPFLGDTVKLPPHGLRPAAIVNSPQSNLPWWFVAVNLNVSGRLYGRNIDI